MASLSSSLASPPLYMSCRDLIASTIMMYADIRLSKLHPTIEETIKEIFAVRCFIPQYPLRSPQTLEIPEEGIYTQNDLDCYWQIDDAGQLYGVTDQVFTAEPLTQQFRLLTSLSLYPLNEAIGRRAEKILPGLSHNPLSSYYLVHYKRYMPLLPVKTADTTSSCLGRGTEAEVFELPSSSHEAWRKPRMSTRLAEAEKNTYSLQKCLRSISVIKEVRPHPHIMKFQGLTFVNSTGIWGLSFEKITGRTLEKWLAEPHTEKEIAQVLIGHIQGMQHLDQSNWPFCDVELSNFMVREPQQEGIVIDWAGDFADSDRSQAAAYQARIAWSSLLLKFALPSSIRDIILRAADPHVSMDTLGWNEMRQQLASLIDLS